jgi:hypothetical protein
MFVLSNFSGQGFNNVTFTNTSSRTVTVRFATVGQTSTASSIKLAAHATKVFSGVASLRETTYMVSASSPAVVITTTLPSAPIGVIVAPVLDGG